MQLAGDPLRRNGCATWQPQVKNGLLVGNLSQGPNYLHGAMEEGTYDDSGLYVYYVMNDFSPYIGWFPITVALFGLVWMAFRERLVSRALGGVTGFFAVVIFGSVVVTGVPGLPFAGSMVLVVVGIWLAVGRSPITQEVAA